MSRISRFFNALTFQGKLFLLVGCLTMIQLLMVYIVFGRFVANTLDEQIGERALRVSQTVALIPEVRDLLLARDPEGRIQEICERIREETGAEFIVVGDTEGIRFSHPKPDRLGKKMVGGDNAPALEEGSSYVSRAVGTLGPSVRGKSPIFDRDGRVIGIVSVGYLARDVRSIIAKHRAAVVVLAAGIFVVGLLGAALIAMGLKRTMHGLEPERIAALYAERKAILDALPDLMFTLDRAGRFLDVRKPPGAVLMMTPDGFIGRTLEEVLPAALADEARAAMERTFETGQVQVIEYQMETGEGVEDFEARFLSMGSERALALIRNITSRKKAEEDLVASLEEKEVLLKEIHHRVKNNLQVISGLLDLQAHHITDRKALAIYRESQNRVITMALIHEDLYQSGDLSRVKFADYLRKLVHNLQASYGVGDRIAVNVEAQDEEIVVDTAIPCGLVVNELITNALKHAFPEGRWGMVTIRFSSTGSGREREYILSVKDNGVGLPEDVDVHRSSSLGLQLVSVISKQMKMRLSVERKGGTSFIMVFKEYFEAGSELH